jgi:hypothetical protein
LSFTRRDFLIGSAALAAGASVTTPFFLPNYHSDRRPMRSRVAVLNAEQYSQQLDQILGDGLRLFRINVRAKTVVLKPNLVDYLSGNAINTHPMLVLAAVEAFRRLGAKSIVVAEGPGHQRDTQLVLSQSGYQEPLREEKIRFIDLNRDELIRTPIRASYTGMKELWLPPDSAGGGLSGVHAKDKDASLVWRHACHEEHVRNCPRCALRMAEEHPALEGHSGEHSRSVRDRSHSLRDCRRNCGHGG